MNVEVDFESNDVERIKLVASEVFKIAAVPFASEGWSKEMQFEDHCLDAVISSVAKMKIDVCLGMGFREVKFNSVIFKDLFFQVRRGPDRYLAIIDFDLNDTDIEQQLSVIKKWSDDVALRTFCLTTTVLE